MPLVASVVTPHPPLIIPEIGRGEEIIIKDTVAALNEVAKRVAKLEPDTIVVISPHATLYKDYFHISPGPKATGSFANFGQPKVKLSVEYDDELIGQIADQALKDRIAAGTEGEIEPKLDHGTLIPLHFIAKEWPNFKVVRIGFSGLSPKVHSQFGHSLAKVFSRSPRKILLVASGDLSHKLKEDGPYGFVKEGPAFDETVVDILSRGQLSDFLKIDPIISKRAAECGLRTFQILAGVYQERKVKSQVLSYEGPFGVGYAVAWLEGLEEKKNSHIELARKTIEHYVLHNVVLEQPADLPAELTKTKAACFVTLNYQGRLRGCIGTLEPYRQNLAQEIISNAISAAFRDPRFRPVQAKELADLVISVDVLSPPQKIGSTNQLDPKIYGVIVNSGFKSGVLLPNLEGINTVEEQVAIASQKAGIGPGEPREFMRFKVVRHEE